MTEPPFTRQLARAVRVWWREASATAGTARAGAQLIRELWEFLRDSTPERSRRRYGDAEYDWNHRVNTTSGSVRWRERLLGTFLSAYQPSDPEAFREMMSALPVDYHEFAFVDLGSGKGRTLLMASDYPFQKIVGVEIVPELHRMAERNIRVYRSPTQRCTWIESVCMDARNFLFPPMPLVLFLFNPFRLAGLIDVLANLERSLGTSPRPVYIVYHNPILEEQLADRTWLHLLRRGEQFVVYWNREHSETSP